MTRKQRQEILDEFLDRHGSYIPHVFINEAKDPTHPAHDWFEWDDGKAGHQYRLWQAQRFVGTLRAERIVQTVDRGLVRIRVPSVVSPLETRDKGGGYVSTASKVGKQHLCHEAAQALRRWIERYGGVATMVGASLAELEAVVRKLNEFS